MEKRIFNQKSIFALGPLVLIFFLVLTGCGDGGGTEPTSAGQPSSDGVADTNNPEDELVNPLAGGGGVLIFDGEQIPIESATCTTFRDTLEVSTTSQSGHRVLIDASDSRGIDANILDAHSVNWLQRDVSGDKAQRNGNTFTSESTQYFNNSDDRVIEASFTVQCP